MSRHKNCGQECKHPELKFCVTCKVPYCLKCGKEWKDNQWQVGNGFLGGVKTLSGSYLYGYDNHTVKVEPQDVDFCKHGK